MSIEMTGQPDFGLFQWGDIPASLDVSTSDAPTLDETHYGVTGTSAASWPEVAAPASFDDVPPPGGAAFSSIYADADVAPPIDEDSVADYVPEGAQARWEAAEAGLATWTAGFAPGSAGTRGGGSSSYRADLPDPEALVKGLNKQQYEAVVHQGEPLLIMAGAGSGKTRVLTHRIAYLLATGRARASEILAITFTNKAAAEMRERVEQLVGSDARRMLVSTFHSACVRILRKEYRAAGLSSTFTIYDSQDSQRLLQIILKAHDVDVKRFTPKLVAARISDLKNELITASQYAETAPSDPVSKVVCAAYLDYAKRLRQANAVDFDDLIMKTVQMLQEHPALAQQYHRRFRHILVDEYQDTNHTQYVLVRELVGTGDDGVPPAELTVVGDSDQSIYAFRGATIRNIEEFERDFVGAHTIMLEQNYRSTQTILSAANAVISKNEGRRPKNLWTDSGEGALIVIDAADSDRDEARFIVSEIDRLGDNGTPWGDIAVFYRTNAQSRAIEELFVRQGIPYRVIGGTRFYERKEIKDALAYLQAIANPDDTVALRRILNTPRRGIGARAEEALVAHSDNYGISFGQALADVWEAEGRPGIPDGTLPPAEDARPRPSGVSPKAAKAIADFWGMLVRLRIEEAGGVSVADILEELLDVTGYLKQLRESEDPQDASRVENLAELHSVAQDFVAAASALEAQETADSEGENPLGAAQNFSEDTEREPAGGTERELAGAPLDVEEEPSRWRLVDFLERISLVADSDQLPNEGEESGQVTMMTVHTAKGLEFPIVFVSGMEDGTFPHQRSLSDPAELAEERRLAYVAITRARERLYLTRACVRAAWGTPQDMLPSRFLDDIPSELVAIRRAGAPRRSAGVQSGAYGSSYGRFGSSASSSHGEGSQISPWDDDDVPTIGSGRSSGLAVKRISDFTTPSTPQVENSSERLTSGAGTSFGGKAVKPDEGATLVLAVGDTVQHKTLGRGTVMSVEGAGPRQVAKIRFASSEKRLLVRMAPMSKI